MIKKRTKITWTDEERISVATEWALLRVDDPFQNSGELLNKAQVKALPESRRRIGLVLAMDKRLKDLCRHEFKELTKMEPIVIPPPPQPPPPDPMEIIKNMPIIELKLYAERRWMEELLQRTQQTSTAPTNQLVNTNGNGHTTSTVVQKSLATPTKSPLPITHYKVTLIGCLPDLARRIQDKLPSEVDVTSVDKSRGIQPNLLPAKFDVTIIHKASRDWFVLAQRTYGEKNVHYIQDRDNIVPKIIQQRSVWIAEQSTAIQAR